MVESILDPNQSFDLSDLGYSFAVRNIDPKYGRIKFIRYYRKEQPDGKMKSIREEIPSVTCDQIDSDGDQMHVFSNTNMRNFHSLFEDKSQFLCIKPGETQVIGGNFHQKNFNYINIQVWGCDLGEDCADLDSYELNSVTVDFMQTDAVVNFDEKDSDEVLERFVNSQYHYKIIPSLQQRENKYFMPSVLKLDDDLL